MKQFLLKLSAYGVLFLLVVNCLGWIGDSILRKSSFFKPSYLLNNFKAEEKLDYIILGSSRGLTTLNSKYIDEQLSLNGVNLSMDDTDLKSHILMLQHFFKNGYKSDSCVLTLDYSDFSNTQIKLGDNDYKFSPFIQKNYIKEHYDSYETLNLKPNYNSRFFPFLKYSYYNLQLVPASLISLVNPNKRHRFDEKGNYTYPKTQSAKHNKVTPTIGDAELNNPLVDEVKKICQDNNTKLLIYVAPYQNLLLNLNDSETVINHSRLITSQELFYDIQHVNSAGREFATLHFVKELKNRLD